MLCDYDMSGCSNTHLDQYLTSTGGEIFNALSTLDIENKPFAFYNLDLSDEDKLFMSTVERQYCSVNCLAC